MDTGGDRVNTMALTMVVFMTAAPRDRDRPLDVTLGDVLSYLHADLPGIGRGGTTVQPVSGLWGRKRAFVCLLFIRCLYLYIGFSLHSYLMAIM
jgi:hypothetical protein